MTPWQNPQLSTVFGRSMKCSRRCSMRRRNVTGLPARPGHWGAVASPSSRPRPGSLALRSAVVLPNSTPAPPAAMIPTPSTCASAAPVVTASAPSLLTDLRHLVDPATRGDPMSPLLWTCKSTRHLAEALGSLGHDVSHQTVARVLTEWGYNLQANRKTEEGKDHPDRDAQFEHINRKVRSFQRRRQPVISVDTKKKELIGNYKNPGREWEPESQPRRVKSKDFPDKVLGKVAPYGVYDLTRIIAERNRPSIRCEPQPQGYSKINGRLCSQGMGEQFVSRVASRGIGL